MTVVEYNMEVIRLVFPQKSIFHVLAAKFHMLLQNILSTDAESK